MGRIVVSMLVAFYSENLSLNPDAVNLKLLECYSQGIRKSSVSCTKDIQTISLHQCDQMARFSFNIWLFTTIKNSPMTKIFPKLGSKVCQSLNEPLKFTQIYKKCQIGSISPNLVTLVSINITKIY